MTAQGTYPRVEKVDGKAACLKRWPRIRITQLVMDYLAHGWPPDEMCRQHPYLSIAEAHAAMAYYYDHQAEIDDEIEQELTHVDHFSANGVRSPLIQRLRAERPLKDGGTVFGCPRSGRDCSSNATARS